MEAGGVRVKTTTCRVCGAPFEQPGLGRQWFCPRCRDQHRASKRAEEARSRRGRYERYLSLGLCPQCGRRRDSDWLQCSTCLERQREARRQSPARPKRAAYIRSLARRRRREGMCPRCGCEIDEPGYKTCSRCRRRARDDYRRRHARQPEETKVI